MSIKSDESEHRFEIFTQFVCGLHLSDATREAVIQYYAQAMSDPYGISDGSGGKRGLFAFEDWIDAVLGGKEGREVFEPLNYKGYAELQHALLPIKAHYSQLFAERLRFALVIHPRRYFLDEDLPATNAHCDLAYSIWAAGAPTPGLSEPLAVADARLTSDYGTDVLVFLYNRLPPLVDFMRMIHNIRASYEDRALPGPRIVVHALLSYIYSWPVLARQEIFELPDFFMELAAIGSYMLDSGNNDGEGEADDGNNVE